MQHFPDLPGYLFAMFIGSLICIRSFKSQLIIVVWLVVCFALTVFSGSILQIPWPYSRSTTNAIILATMLSWVGLIIYVAIVKKRQKRLEKLQADMDKNDPA